MRSLNPEILTYLERCDRLTRWGQQWENEKLHPTELTYRGITAAMLDNEREDKGELAGEMVISLAADRGIDTHHSDVYGVGLHHAVLADILVTHLGRTSKTQWSRPPILDCWNSLCFLEGAELHRVILVDHWTDDRFSAEAHSWYTLGEMAAYGLGMTLHVFILGASVSGRRHSAWTKGILHPKNHKLRFQKKSRKSTEDFADSWQPIWREDHDEITREQWLSAMAEDDQLDKLAIVKRIEPLSAERVAEVRQDIAESGRELDRIPEQARKRYSVCDWPIPCQFKRCCWNVVDLTPVEIRDYREKK